MSQPVAYSRQYNFTNYQTVTPSQPLPAAYVDLELNSVKATLDQILNNLALIQRDDTALANTSVGYDQLKAELNGFGFNPPTAWVTATNYVVRDTVFQSAKFYQCLVSHVSGVFATDLGNGDWLLISDFNVNPVETQTVAASAVTTIGDTDLIANVQTTGPALKKIVWTDFIKAVFVKIAGLTAKATPIGADTVAISDSAAANAGKSVTLTNWWAQLGVFIAAFTAKATPVDADIVPIADSAASNAGKGTTFANFKKNVLAGLVVRTQIFTASGTYTPNANMVYAILETWGSGGAGGGAASTTAGTVNGGGGGGAGSYSLKVVSAATVGASQVVTVGAAGVAGAAGNNPGGNGGDVSVGTLCVAKGGTGGSGAASATAAGGGSGGVAGTGDIAAPGANGYPGGNASIITVLVSFGGNGAGNSFGTGGAGGINGSGNGPASYGAGGGGASDYNAGGNKAGSIGGKGIVRITEFCSA